MAALVVLFLLFMMTHGTVEADGFCDVCHTRYYDPSEYSFNDKVGMEKPKGVLTGCAECHPQPYREYKESPHFDTDLEERRPGCTNCHTKPHTLFQWLKYMYYSPPEWERVQLSLHDDTFWEEKVRPDLAMKARKALVVSKSKPCKDCHLKTFKRNIKAHKKALGRVNDDIGEVICVGCHFNFVHGEAPWDEKKKDIKRWLEEAG